MSNEVLAAPKKSILAAMASKYSVDPDNMLKALKDVAFRQGEGKVVSNEQMIALLIVSNQYNLNPFLKEIYAYPDKNGGIVPVVGIDGWNRIANDHPQYDGDEIEWSDEIVQLEGAKPCPAWAKIKVYRKDRSHPTVHTEYLDECFRHSNYKSPWQTHTKRMLEHKTRIQGYRASFGFGGIYDDDEAQRIVEASVVEAEAEVVSTRRPVNMQPVTRKSDKKNMPQETAVNGSQIDSELEPTDGAKTEPETQKQPAQAESDGPSPHDEFVISATAVLDEFGFATQTERDRYISDLLKPFRIAALADVPAEHYKTIMSELSRRYREKQGKK